MRLIVTTPSDQSPIELAVDPPFAAQRALLDRSAQARSKTTIAGPTLTELRTETRDALGLPRDRPAVVTGHQAGIWHAGILAKWLLADRLARESDGMAVQLVVDQDINDAAVVAYPTLRHESLTTATLPVTSARRSGPTGLQPAIELEPPVSAPLEEVSAGVNAIAAAVRSERAASSLAVQFSAATLRLLGERIAPMATICATRLLDTPLGAALLSEMRRDPSRCAATYNAALAADPHVARPLDDGELPLWRIERGSNERARVHADAISTTEGLAPRAFLMTAIVRLGVCDLFIHGTGGARYERVTEAWIRAWLGVELAPMSVATATIRLPLARYLPTGATLSRSALQRFRWDPDTEPGASGPSPEKSRLLAAIASLPRRSRARRDAYLALTRHVRERREARSLALANAEALVESSRSAAAAHLVASSRTWPWPLHAPSSIDELSRLIARS